MNGRKTGKEQLEHLERESNVREEERVAQEGRQGVKDAESRLGVLRKLLACHDITNLTKASANAVSSSQGRHSAPTR